MIGNGDTDPEVVNKGPDDGVERSEYEIVDGDPCSVVVSSEKSDVSDGSGVV